MSIPLPDEASRWRCGHCGNLTRFDVTRTRTVREFWHFSLAGVPDVEETAVDAEVVTKVVCRWCGSSDRIETVPRPAPGETEEDRALGRTP
jgi:hypothetical protein